MTDRLIRVIQQIAGEEGAYLAKVEINNHDAAELLPILEATDRAWWWDEVEPGYKFRAGEPYREESPVRGEHGERVYEGFANRPFTLQPVEGARTRFFIDTRWTPPVKPLKVGDEITTAEGLERLPVGAGVVDDGGALAQKTVSGGFQFTDHNPMSHTLEPMIHCAPLTIVYLPKVDGSDE